VTARWPGGLGIGDRVRPGGRDQTVIGVSGPGRPPGRHRRPRCERQRVRAAGGGGLRCAGCAAGDAGGGQMWFWWGWAQPIAPVTDLPAVAAAIDRVLRILGAPSPGGNT
jgi:hypothetical protein